jgi:hypothetical protein
VTPEAGHFHLSDPIVTPQNKRATDFNCNPLF